MDITTREELIQVARESKKWIFIKYQQLWYSPNEFEKAIKEGRFNWPISSFELRSPFEKIKEISSKINALEIQKRGIRERINIELAQELH